MKPSKVMNIELPQQSIQIITVKSNICAKKEAEEDRIYSGGKFSWCLKKGYSKGFGIQFGFHFRLDVILEGFFLGLPIGGGIDSNGLELTPLLHANEGHTH